MPKLICCDGSKYEVWDLGALMVRLRHTGKPIPHRGTRIVEDGEARAELRKLLDSEMYEREI